MKEATKSSPTNVQRWEFETDNKPASEARPTGAELPGLFIALSALHAEVPQHIAICKNVKRRKQFCLPKWCELHPLPFEGLPSINRENRW
jgi:hypothetical protein